MVTPVLQLLFVCAYWVYGDILNLCSSYQQLIWLTYVHLFLPKNAFHYVLKLYFK